MVYYKIIQNGKVIDAGHTFICWNEKHHQMFACDPDYGQFVGGRDGNSIYRDEWMKPYPDEARGFQIASVEVINETDFKDICDLLDEGEEVETAMENSTTLEELPPPVRPDEKPEEPEEKPLTIAQMREIIQDQQDQINMLMKMIKNNQPVDV